MRTIARVAAAAALIAASVTITAGCVATPSPGVGGPVAPGTPLGVEDGFHDDEPIDPLARVPATEGLDPGLRDAIRAAAEDARADGVDFWLTSGWRSARFQQHLLDEAVREYGDEEEALKLVQTPEASRHVSGDAVDVGPTDANSWMSIHGTAYGLCQVYANEMWHFELLIEPGGECPPMKLDAS